MHRRCPFLISASVSVGARPQAEWGGELGFACMCPTLSEESPFQGQQAALHVSACCMDPVQLSSVTQSCPTLVTPWAAACQASLSITNSWSLLKLMSIELVMPSNPLILCSPLLLLPSIFPSIRVFSDESVLCCISWPKYWSFSKRVPEKHLLLLY